MNTTETGGSGAWLLPPAPNVCQQCAVDHDPRMPHNQQSLYWNYWFYSQHGRWPTWEDALAHCSTEMQRQWVTALAEHGITVKLPNAPGERPEPKGK